MNISPISYNSNPNFGITSKVRIPMKDGTTTLLFVVGDAKKNGSLKIKRIFGKIMSKGKAIADTKNYVNKKGFDEQELAVIATELGTDAKNPEPIIGDIIDSIACPRIDYNA